MSRTLSHLLKNLLASQEAIEAPEEGSTQEIEYTVWGKLKDPEQLKQAERWESQEQWDLRNDKGDTVRVRCVNDEHYRLCVKYSVKGQDGRVETEYPIDKDIFESIKMIATAGMRKKRYFFPIENGLVWEVDLFEGDWLKLDLEVKAFDGDPPAYPIDVIDPIIDIPGSLNEQEKAKLKEHIETNIVLKNPNRS